MGMYDYVEVDDDLLDIEPDDAWQTKHRRQPFMETFRIDEYGLWLENVEYYTVPREERPYYDDEIDGFEEPYQEWFGSIGQTKHAWERWVDFHGIFEFHGFVDGDLREFEAKFTDGELEEIREVTPDE